MAPTEPYEDLIGFQGDFSDGGILTTTVTLEALPPNVKPSTTKAKKRKLNDGPTKATIPLWYALKLDGETEAPQTKEHFVSCRFRDSIEVFILKTDFEVRLPNKDGTHWKIYEQDWAKGGDALACHGYSDWGIEIGKPGSQTSWPANGFIARQSARSTPETLEWRYRNQAQIWFDIATKYMTAGSSRLWKPAAWPHGRPIKLYFLPIGTWPSRAELSEVVEALKTDAKKKAENMLPGRLSLLKWLDWEVPTATPEGLVKISRNLLNHYETFISGEDLQILVAEQTQKGADWKRPWPTEDQAKKAQDDILEKADEQYKHFMGRDALREVVVSRIYPSKGTEARVDASKIMGSQSANKLATRWWAPKDGPKVIAEWLHRSAYSLGPLEGANYQSPENIVFGTFEANSDMTRAELLVRNLRSKSEAKGNLTTRMITASTVDDPQLKILNPATGNEEPWEIPAWVQANRYPWMAPGLLYKGNMTLPEHELSVIWSTRFHTFSRYSPIILKGSIDVKLFDKFFKAHPGTAASSPEKISKAGPSTKPAESTTDFTPLVTATPSLAAPGPPGRPAAYADFSTATYYIAPDTMANISSHRFMVLDANLPPEPESQAPRPNINDQRTTVTPHPRTHVAWQAIRKNADSVKLGDVEIKKPFLVVNDDIPGSLPLAPPAAGFLIGGTLKVFGLDREVQLQSWHGPTPPDVQLGSEPPIYQRVLLGSLRPSELIPLLEGTPFSDFELQNVIVTRQNYQ
ncbi:hypothetical protein FRC09_002495, partial [Ceratobasidium sp. 395]